MPTKKVMEYECDTTGIHFPETWLEGLPCPVCGGTDWYGTGHEWSGTAEDENRATKQMKEYLEKRDKRK